jgi:PAS domain S-box-containing protein
MKLATRGRIVIFIPVFFQLILSITLLFLLYQAQEDMARSARSQDIVNRSNDLIRTWMNSMMTLGLAGKGEQHFNGPMLDKQLQEVDQKGQELRNILMERGDEGGLCQKLADSSAAVSAVVRRKWADLTAGGHRSMVAEGRIQIEGLPLLRATFLNLEEIVLREANFQAEKHEVREAQLNRLKLFLFLFVTGGIAVSIIASADCILYIRSRLKLMTENTKRFAARQTLTPARPGNDELATLDHVFHAVDRAIAEASEREHTLIENAAELICSVDRNAFFQQVSSYSRRLLGREPQELLGKSVLDVVAKHDVLTAHNELDAACTKEGARTFEVAMITYDHSDVETLWSTFWSEREESLFCVISDITERKNIARLKEDFVAMISHDLRTPLMSLSLDISLLIRAGDSLSDQAKTSLAAAEQRVELLIAFVNDLLDYVKLDAGKMQFDTEVLKLELLAAPLRAEFAAQAESFGIKMNWENNWNQFVRVDVERMTQLLKNLFSNAIRRAPAGSEISINIEESDAAVEISIADAGPMPQMQTEENIFLPFSGWESNATEGRLRGTGLELPICKLIAQGLDGTIGVRKDSQDRTCFWLTIPKLAPTQDFVD